MRSNIIAVLSDVQYDQEHHFGRPFLTPYQITIVLVSRHPTICSGLGLELGGVGTGSYNSLIQYIAQQLSTRIKSGEITDIEGAFLSNIHLSDITFRDAGGRVIQSSNSDQSMLSLFRLREY